MPLHRTGRYACIVVGIHGERRNGALFSEFCLLLMVSWWSRCAEQWQRIERPYALAHLQMTTGMIKRRRTAQSGCPLMGRRGLTSAPETVSSRSRQLSLRTSRHRIGNLEHPATEVLRGSVPNGHFEPLSC